ncbi:restriction endonuclease subunit S [Methanomethylophilus alvi]|uniref:restriction endonuclease subunit S n=1 Tax=Methanomethylophilus alvi TaxID=1291540 RepID=UPI0037DCBE7E
MAIKGSGSPMETVDEYFDMLIKSRFNEMFEDQNYQLIRLGDILKQNTTVTKVDCPDKETFVTLSSKGRGAKKREIKDGKTPVAFSGYRIHAGQFIYSRIDARNAAFDIVPECLEGAVVSKDFPVFDFDTNAIEPVYLLHSVLQNSFIEQIQSSSFGATNRQRIKEETMMNYSIELPPLSKQREYSQFVQLTIIIKKHYQQLMDSFDILVKSRFIEMFGTRNEYAKKWQMKPFTACCDVLYGYPFNSQLFNDNGEGMPLIRVRDINTAFSNTYTTENVSPIYQVHDGDILVGMDGDFYAKIWSSGTALLNQRTCKMKGRRDVVNDLFMLHYLNPELLEIHRNTASTTVKHLSAKEINKMQMPLPPIELQEQFVAFVKQVDKSKFEVVQSLLRLKSKYMRTETPSKRTDCDL